MKVKGQDPQFTQFYANKLYLSPSFAGATKQHRIGTIYRKQWLGIANGYETYAVSYDHYFDAFNSGLGLIAVKDAAGSASMGFLDVGISYSYDFQVNDYWHVRPGVGFYYYQYGFDFYKLIFKDQINFSGTSPVSIEDPPYDERVGAFDAATSVLVYSDKFWSGLTVDHLMMPNQSFWAGNARVPLEFSLYGGMQIVRKGKLLRPIDETVSVAYMYKHQKDKKQLDLGLYWFKMPMVLGFWYRGIPLVNSDRGDALAILAGFKMQNFSVGYSYDFTISNLINSSKGAHEISLVYEFQTTRKKKIHAIPCPEF